MTHLRPLCLLMIAVFALLAVLPAAAQTPAASEIPPIDELDGIEAAVDRTWGQDIEAMLAATPDLQPEDFEQGVTVLSAMVLRFDTEDHAMAAYEAFREGVGAQLLDLSQGGTPTVSEEPIGDLGDAASAATLTTTAPDQETYLRFVLAREGRYFFVTHALATTSDEAIFVADGGSSGGLWGFMPPDDADLLNGLVPILDETLYPAP